MRVLRSLDEFEAFRAGLDGSVGFVPTMGALHAGHLSLVEIAKDRADHVIVSIYVNPTQFAPNEDFDAYPRDAEADLALLEEAGVDAVYLPDTHDIYPDGAKVSVRAGAAAEGLESDFRPHFFDGVCSVVHRLFEIVRPDLAVFGEKDYQQLMVIREMVEAHGMGIDIVGAPIIRDEHGLALSSRNAYLKSAEELEIARKLNLVLTRAKYTHNLEEAKQELLQYGFDKVDYLDTRANRILTAVWLGETRLIDNVEILPAKAESAYQHPLQYIMAFVLSPPIGVMLFVFFLLLFSGNIKSAADIFSSLMLSGIAVLYYAPIFAYPVMLLLGIPLLIMCDRFGFTKLYQVMLAGAMVGIMSGVVIGFFVSGIFISAFGTSILSAIFSWLILFSSYKKAG